MAPVAPSLQTEEVKNQARSIFDTQRQAIYGRTDRLFALLMALQWAGAVLAACFLSPRTWAGTESQVHPHILAAVFVGGLISIFPICLALACPGQGITRQVIAVSQLLMSSLLIHLTGGQETTHFHIFGSLAFLAFYRDWRVLVTATVVTATDHLVQGAFWPKSIYGLAAALPGLTAEHIGWVAFEDIFLLVSCRQSLYEMQQISLRQAQLEVAEGILLQSHELLETRVTQRTQALAKMQRQNELLLNAAGEGVYGIDIDGKTLFANPTAAGLLGYEVSELIGQPMHTLLHHTHADGASYPSEDCPIYKCLSDGQVRRVDDEVFWCKDGTSFDVEYISTPLVEDGCLVGAVVTFQDVTERKRAGKSIIALNSELIHAYDATIEGWSRALDLRDHETEGHSRRVTEMTLRLARAAGIPEDQIIHVRRGALLHDIGKMGVPDRILLKPGPLDDDEWAIMRRHPGLAREMLAPAKFLHPALDIPYCHHEKWNGTGYPQGLRGEEIPLAARLFALVDVWDALTSDRPYRRAWPRERVMDHLRSLAGTHFDPNVVAMFLSLLEQERPPEEVPPAPLARPPLLAA